MTERVICKRDLSQGVSFEFLPPARFWLQRPGVLASWPMVDFPSGPRPLLGGSLVSITWDYHVELSLPLSGDRDVACERVNSVKHCCGVKVGARWLGVEVDMDPDPQYYLITYSGSGIEDIQRIRVNWDEPEIDDEIDERSGSGVRAVELDMKTVLRSAFDSREGLERAMREAVEMGWITAEGANQWLGSAGRYIDMLPDAETAKAVREKEYEDRLRKFFESHLSSS